MGDVFRPPIFEKNALVLTDGTADLTSYAFCYAAAGAFLAAVRRCNSGVGALVLLNEELPAYQHVDVAPGRDLLVAAAAVGVRRHVKAAFLEGFLPLVELEVLTQPSSLQPFFQAWRISPLRYVGLRGQARLR